MGTDHHRLPNGNLSDACAVANRSWTIRPLYLGRHCLLCLRRISHANKRASSTHRSPCSLIQLGSLLLGAQRLASLAKIEPHGVSSTLQLNCPLIERLQQTRLVQNLTCRHAQYAHHLCCSLSGDTSHLACAYFHMQTGVICPSLVLLTHSVLSADPAQGITWCHGSHGLPPTIHQSISQNNPQTAEM